MKLYGKRFMTNRADVRISDRKESRDAVVYDINEANRYCRVRVAGSLTLVRAWFPANFMRTPYWLKVGSAVRISHVGGDKSRIEAISSGLVQPTQAASALLGGVDTVLLGMYLTAGFENVSGRTVRVSTGTYRIDGVSFIFSPSGPAMDNEGWFMGDGGDMSGTYWLGTVDPMVNDVGLWFRYDAFVIGEDGVVDYLKGDEWEWVSGGTGPTKPTVPAGHVLVRNYILVWSGTTAITQKNIGAEWAAPYPHHLDIVYYYMDPAYGITDTYVRMEDGKGIIKGGPDVYVPASPGGIQRGSIQSDMTAEATITVMTQYDTPYSWWSSGSMNQLVFQWLGSHEFDHYGEASLGLGWGAIEPPTDESGFGVAKTVDLGLGSGFSIGYVRENQYVVQSNPAVDGYPGYYVGTGGSHTALIQVTLVSPETIHPVTNILVFFNLDAIGALQ